MADITALKERAQRVRDALWSDPDNSGTRWPRNIQGGTQGTITILNAVYGPNSHQVQSFQDRIRKGVGEGDHADHLHAFRVARDIEGVLAAALDDLETGIAAAPATMAKGEVLGDFVVLARSALGENSAESDRVAAVLAAAALEETLKQLGAEAGIDVYGRDMRGVLEKLKQGEVLIGPQFSLAHGYVAFRDKALHAQFDQIHRGTTESALTFIEGLLLDSFA